ncbi:hypothetical protein [Paenibacillus baimaensis]
MPKERRTFTNEFKSQNGRFSIVADRSYKQNPVGSSQLHRFF